MYLATTRAADEANGISVRPAPAGRRRRVSGNVLALGAVSLITDASAEMVTAILPIYLLVGLGLSPFAVGVVGSVNALGSLLLRVVGGHLADRTQRRKGLAGIGYGISAGAKLALLVAGGAVGWISAAVGLDRLGKGLRTAPRDALISLSSDPAAVGRAFGVHRAMDTVGALLGPITAFLVVWAWPGRYDAVFVVSFCLAVMAVVVLLLFVRDHRAPLVFRSLVSLRAVADLARDRNLRRICLNAGVLGLVTIGDAFVYLLLQRRLDVTISSFVLLPFGTAAVFLLLAAPLGRLADRVGRWRVFVGGYVALLIAYALLLTASVSGWPLLVGVLACYGAFYAATDGVLMAVATPHLPAPLRTTGMALVQSCSVGTGLVAALAFGAGWSFAGPGPVLIAFAGALALALGVAVLLAPRSPRPAPHA
jgi:MFS family permease